MIQPINNLAQQSFVAPLQQRGEQQQQQVNQRQQDNQTSVTSRTPQTTETRPSGTESAQSQRSNNTGTGRAFTEFSVSEFRAEFGDQPPQRGSLVDISA